MSSKFLQISTTLPDKVRAEEVAAALLQQKLTKCVQIIGPITSNYRWKGGIERTEEWLCLIKAEEYNFETIEQCISSLHSYELPEIIATPIIKGSYEYLDWLSYP